MSFVYSSIIKRVFDINRTLFRKTAYRNYPAPIKRFYKNVHVSESNGSYEICLDKRKLKTPSGNLMQLPNEALAVAIATEWDMQCDIIKQHDMHLTALSNTAVDNPCKQTTEGLADNMLQYLSSDTLCFRSIDPPSLAELQSEKWDPVLKWFVDRYQVNVNICQDVSTEPVPEETLNKIKKQLVSYSYWSLLGMNFATENLKSLILTLAIVNRVIDVEQGVNLSRLETLYQVQRWGSVEWAHNVDEAQLKARVAAGTLFTYLNEGSSDFIETKYLKKLSVTGKG